jgi:hypothetical protein
MVSDRHFAHQDESGHNVVGRVLATDPSLGDRWLVLGENLGWGSYSLATPRSMVEGWMHSPTHRDNILFAEFDEIGVGITRGAPIPGGSSGALTYTTVFGKVAPPASRSATTRNRCLHRARVKAHRAHSHRARVRAAKAKRACLAKARASRR